MGAWIEILNSLMHLRTAWSLPSWERGLKLQGSGADPGAGWSLPSWERGLKLRQIGTNGMWICVAPFVGAWIEITSLLQSHLRLHVALLVEEGNVM